MTGERSVTSVSRADTRSRVSKLSQNKFKANKRVKGQKLSQSPCLGTSRCYQNDFETPKRRARNRFNAGSNGDSPSEAEAVQDIIWDPASPPPNWNNKGPGGSAVEISDIVERIAPNDKKPVDCDPVLQWIGDSVVSCTPEIQRPRVRRISARRQSNKVEDLMKLAKQFDISMNRQDKERNMERQSEGQPIKDLNQLNKSTASRLEPERTRLFAATLHPEGLSHEEELRALFDGPTQHVSGRLSPPSANCSQESRNELTALGEKRPSSGDGKKHPEQVPTLDFDDDWENDDLLNDSFVLELTQNPELISTAAEKKAGLDCLEALRKSDSVSAADSVRSGEKTWQIQSGSNSSSHTRMPTKAPCNNTSTFRQRTNTSFQTGTVQNPHKTSVDSAKAESNGSSEVKDSKTSGQLLGNNHTKAGPGNLWDDGDDDELLCQACDHVERLSASQEQQNAEHSELTSNELTNSSSKTCLLTNAASFSSMLPPGRSTEPEQPVRVFARSHSMPATSGGLAQNLGSHKSSGDLQRNQNPQAGRRGQYHFTQVKLASGSGSVSHHSTFKRHQSDPMALGKKVFVVAQPPVKCSAAEIERKKQEAIARRRLRLQATQKPEAAM